METLSSGQATVKVCTSVHLVGSSSVMEKAKRERRLTPASLKTHKIE